MRTRHVWSSLVAGILVLALMLPALVLPALGQDIGQFGRHPLGPWAWAAGGTFFLLRTLLVIGLVILVWRLLGARGLWKRPDSATQILRERYARGEIGEDEYRKRLASLS